MASVIANATMTAAAPKAMAAGRRGRQMLGWLEDAGLSLLLIFAIPLAVLIVGTPLAFAVRLLIEVARRWS